MADDKITKRAKKKADRAAKKRGKSGGVDEFDFEGESTLGGKIVTFFLTYYMKDMEYSVKSLTDLYTFSSPTENYLWLLWNFGHEIQKKKFL